jgi:glycosyltransferase involved in cell wall biosynthesis
MAKQIDFQITTPPLVSVVMITYNHEKFIAEAIEGVLMQEVDFEVELIIADDCSPDKTEEIVKKYIENHPKGNWIKYTKHRQNTGMMPNFIWALQQTKGEYIALCEGDDYWTDSDKLKTQFEFLNKNFSNSAYMHRVKYLYNTPEIVKNNKLSAGYDEYKNCSVEEVLQYKIDGTSSILFRKLVLTEIPAFFYKIKNGDTALFALCALKGPIYFNPKVMSVYRVHSGGITQASHFSGLNYISQTNTFLNLFDEFTKHKYYQIIHHSKVIFLKECFKIIETDNLTKLKYFILFKYYNFCLSLNYRFSIKLNKHLKL